MQCLIVTILCSVDHFTSFIAVLLLLTMVCSEFCHSTCAVPRTISLSCISDWLSILAFFSNKNIKYRENIKIDIGTFLIDYKTV